jgi:hypothetical protein
MYQYVINTTWNGYILSEEDDEYEKDNAVVLFGVN